MRTKRKLRRKIRENMRKKKQGNMETKRQTLQSLPAQSEVTQLVILSIR